MHTRCVYHTSILPYFRAWLHVYCVCTSCVLYVQDIFLFQHMSKKQIADVVRVISREKVLKGDCVIQQGDEGDKFYIVDTGEYDVRVLLKTAAPCECMDILGYTPHTSPTVAIDILMLVGRQGFQRQPLLYRIRQVVAVGSTSKVLTVLETGELLERADD